MNIILSLLSCGLLFLMAYAVRRSDHSTVRRYFWPALFVKLTAGILLGLLYRYYYTVGDTLIYFEEGRRIAQMAAEDWYAYFQFVFAGKNSSQFLNAFILDQPRAVFMIKLVSTAAVVSGNNYWMMATMFSWISFLGAWYMTTTIVRIFPKSETPALISFLFFPSIVFWSSGLIKESVAAGALFVVCAWFVKFWNRSSLRVWEYVCLPLALWLLWELKYYYVAVLAPVLVASLLSRYVFFPIFKPKSIFAQLFLWSVIFLGPLFVVSFTRPNFYFDNFLQVIVSNYQAYESLSAPGDIIQYHQLAPTWGSVLVNVPWALFSCWFRPFVWEATAFVQGFAAVENLILLVLLTTAVMSKRNSLSPSPWRMVTFAVIVYSVLLGVFLALSTPNFGTLNRYRIGFLPFLVFLLTYGNHWVDRLSQILQRRFPRLVP